MAVAPAPPAAPHALAICPPERRVEWPDLFKDAVVAALIAGRWRCRLSVSKPTTSAAARSGCGRISTAWA